MKKIATVIIISAMALMAGGCRGTSKAVSQTDDKREAKVTEIRADADSLLSFVAAQTSLGPRVPGTNGHSLAVDYFKRKLSGYGAVVAETDTIFVTPSGKSMRVRNITGSFNSSTARKRVMLLAHYDTRPWADRDADPANHSTPIDGANDGASGVAVILEIARHAESLPKTLGLELLLVDAEDGGEYSEDDTWCVGSQAWGTFRRPSDPRIDYAILLDMVGGKGACFHREYFSEAYAKEINDMVWDNARSLGYADRFIDRTGGAINDDHLAILRAGIPCIDIIESQNPETGSFNPTWHTLADNLSNIDPSTMKIVADVVLKTLNN